MKRTINFFNRSLENWQLQCFDNFQVSHWICFAARHSVAAPKK